MSRPVFLLHISIIVLGIFSTLAAIPYLVNIAGNSTAPAPVESLQIPVTTTPEKIIPKPAPALPIKLPPKPAPEPATTTPVAAPVTLPASKFGKLLEQQAALGIVDPRDERELWAGVVAIHCSSGGKTIVGSGIILDNSGLIATNNHVVSGSASGNCQALFPAFSENTGYSIRARGTFPTTLVAASGNNDNDIAILRVEKLADFETQVEYHRKYYGWTGAPFAFIPYPFCRTASLSDKIIHYDWQVVNSASEGYEALRTVSTVTDFLNIYNGIFYYTRAGETPDYIVTDAKKFGGASGGLAFDASKDCILGLTSRSGETTLILNISNPKAKALIPQ